MKKTQWWLRLVGAFYLLLGVMNVVVALFSPEFGAATVLPQAYSADQVTVTALNVANIPPTLAWVVLGALMLYFSREPARASILVLTVALLELFTWIPYDVAFLLTGLSAAIGIPFFILHLIIGVTGIFFLRQARAE